MMIQLLLAALAAALPAVPNLSAAPPPTAQGSDESYQPLRDRYDDALRVWNEARTSGDLGKPHPARAYWPRFETVGEKGDVLALNWLLDNLGLAFDDAAQTSKQGLWVIERLFQTKPSEEAELALLAKINKQIDVLPEDTVLDLCQAVLEKSPSPQTRAQALWLCAWVRSEKGTTQDPLRRAEATEIHNTILMDYPNTFAGQRSASEAFKFTNQEFFDAVRKWIESVRELQTAGRPPQEWPPLPIEKFRPLFVPLARAKNLQAVKWLKDLYPAFERARRQADLGQGIESVVAAIGAVYPLMSQEVNNLRLDMLAVLYAQFPSEAWILPSLQSLRSSAEYLPPAATEKTVSILAEKSADPAVRALALSVQADLASSTSEVASDRRAVALYQRVLDEHPTSEVAPAARSKHDKLAHILPGAPAPEMTEADDEGKDAHLADYKGQVVMVDFYALKNDDCVKTAPLRGALAKSMVGRPFTLLGVRVGVAVPKRIDEHAASYGFPLRSLILPMSEHVILSTWMIRKYPTTFVIDAEGVIRARDLPWEEMVAVVERLVADAQVKRPQK